MAELGRIPKIKDENDNEGGGELDEGDEEWLPRHLRASESPTGSSTIDSSTASSTQPPGESGSQASQQQQQRRRAVRRPGRGMGKGIRTGLSAMTMNNNNNNSCVNNVNNNDNSNTKYILNYNNNNNNNNDNNVMYENEMMECSFVITEVIQTFCVFVQSDISTPPLFYHISILYHIISFHMFIFLDHTSTHIISYHGTITLLEIKS